MIVILKHDHNPDQLESLISWLKEMGITIHYQIPVPDLCGARQKELSRFGRFHTVTYANGWRRSASSC